MFSVIMPTLQRSDKLPGLIAMYCAHPLVDEVIVINNAPKPLLRSHPKLRVLDQESNLFVNPSWNLGAQEATSDWLIISNDDIAFAPRLIDRVAGILRRYRVGVVGPDPAAFARRDRTPWFLPTYSRTSGFGTLMFMPASNFVDIPGDLLIWAGDDWLFDRQTRRNYYIKGASIDSQMSTTASAPEFETIKQADRDLYRSKYCPGSYGSRFRLEADLWHNVGRIKHLAERAATRVRDSGGRSNAGP